MDSLTEVHHNKKQHYATNFYKQKFFVCEDSNIFA
jgi:hypothetical protein